MSAPRKATTLASAVSVLFLGAAAVAPSALAAPGTGTAPDPQQVTVSTSNLAAPIDVVLSKGQTTQDLSTFKAALLQKITNDGYDANRINVQEITASSKSVSSAFTWNTDRSSSINSSWGFTNNGSSFAMTGNPSLPGKGANWVNLPLSSNTQKFSFNYSLDFGDNFNSAGMLLNVKDEGSYLTGNILHLGKSVTSGTGVQNSYLGTFRYDKATNSTNISSTYGAPLNIPAAGSLQVEVKADAINVYSNGSATPAGTLVTSTRGGSGFGFYSDHYAHGCSVIGQFSFNNLQLVETNEKTMTEVLQSPTWQDNSYRALVNVADPIEKDFQDPNTRSTVLARFLNQGIHYLAWGSSINKASNDAFVASNDSKGFAVTTPSFTDNINATAKYLEDNFYKNAISDSDYVVIDAPIAIDVDPPSARTGTDVPGFRKGSWKFTQDPDYFYNGNGIYAKNDEYQIDLPTTVDKVGKYLITYQDTLVKTLYVHRKPNAVFNYQYCSKVGNVNCTFNGKTVPPGTIVYDNLSSDPDTDPAVWNGSDQDQGLGAGITEAKWEWRYTNASSWTQGSLPTTKGDPTNDILVRLTVKDAQGAWSDPLIKTITDGANVLPVADFGYDSQTITLGTPLKINNTSYAPNGLGLTKYAWTLERSVNGGWAPVQSWVNPTASTSNLKTSFPTKAEAGGYRYTLKVTNSLGLESRAYTLGFYVESDVTAPTILSSVGGSSTWYKQGFPLTLTFGDSESGLLEYAYLVNTNATAPGAANKPAYTFATAPTVNLSIPSAPSSVYYVHAYAYDKVGNSTFKTFGPYQVDGKAPTGTCKAGWAPDGTTTQVTCEGQDDFAVENWLFGEEVKGGPNATFNLSPQAGAFAGVVKDPSGNSTKVVVVAPTALKLSNPRFTSLVNVANSRTPVAVTVANRTPLVYTLNPVTVTANGDPLTCEATSLKPGESTECTGTVATSSVK